MIMLKIFHLHNDFNIIIIINKATNQLSQLRKKLFSSLVFITRTFPKSTKD